MPLYADAVRRRVPASSGPNLPGARTGAAATPRLQLSCAAQGCPSFRCLPARGLAAVSCGRRPLRRWHRRRSKLLSETLVGASVPFSASFGMSRKHIQAHMPLAPVVAACMSVFLLCSVGHKERRQPSKAALHVILITQDVIEHQAIFILLVKQ